MGEASLAMDVARELESPAGDLPREVGFEDGVGTGRGPEGEEGCLWPDIVRHVTGRPAGLADEVIDRVPCQGSALFGLVQTRTLLCKLGDSWSRRR